jgi:hypothetical protein
MGDIKVTPTNVLSKVRTDLKAMETAHTKVRTMYLHAKEKRDIIRTSCTHEKWVRIKNLIALARESFSFYLMKRVDSKTPTQDAAALKKQIDRFRRHVGNIVKEAKVCKGEEIVLISKPTVTTTNEVSYRSCFRQPGVQGTPRLIFVNKRSAGFGIKFSVGAEYVSSWDKNAGRSDGARAVINLGLAGINLTGGRWGAAVFLLGLSGGIGFGNLYGRNSAGQMESSSEYTPRAGLDLHMLALARGYITLMLKGGYQVSLTKNRETEESQTHHGGYAGLGLEFYIPKFSRFLSPEINVTYTGYQKGRHEVAINALLRF